MRRILARLIIVKRIVRCPVTGNARRTHADIVAGKKMPGSGKALDARATF
jgi:hypothetical protein